MQIELVTVSLGGAYQKAPHSLVKRAVHQWTESNGFGLPSIEVRSWNISADEVDASLEYDNVDGLDVYDLLALSDRIESAVEHALFKWDGKTDGK